MAVIYVNKTKQNKTKQNKTKTKQSPPSPPSSSPIPRHRTSKLVLSSQSPSTHAHTLLRTILTNETIFIPQSAPPSTCPFLSSTPAFNDAIHFGRTPPALQEHTQSQTNPAHAPDLPRYPMPKTMSLTHVTFHHGIRKAESFRAAKPYSAEAEAGQSTTSR